MSTTTEGTTAHKVGDKVRAVPEATLEPFEGTVADVGRDKAGNPNYVVRKVSNEPEYERFTEADLEAAPDAEFLDQHDMAALKRELIYNVTDTEFPEFGIDSSRRTQRIVTYNRIAWLASRLAWLETVDLPSFHD